MRMTLGLSVIYMAVPLKISFAYKHAALIGLGTLLKNAAINIPSPTGLKTHFTDAKFVSKPWRSCKQHLLYLGTKTLECALSVEMLKQISFTWAVPRALVRRDRA